MEMYFNRICWIRRGISSPFQIRSVKSYLSKTVNYILSVRQGYLLSTSIFYLSKEFSFWFVFKYTIFHGVFEILAIILVGAFALKPAVVTFKCIIKKPFFQKKRF